MDDLLREFLTETGETLDALDVELVSFERDPNNARSLAAIFRLVHTIKGTCGFLGLPRLEALAHAVEDLLARYRDGAPVTAAGVSLVLETIDRIKDKLAVLEMGAVEPKAGDDDLIAQLEAMAAGNVSAAPRADGGVLGAIERAFRDTPGPDSIDLSPEAARAAAAEAIAERPQASETQDAPESPAALAPARPADPSLSTIRIQVCALEHMMEMVSELVLTRNQLLETARQFGDGPLHAPLQRLSAITGELQTGIMKARMQPIGNAWRKLPRLVRDLSRELGKPIEIKTQGGETEVDRQVLELIKDPLTHMVRNAADHGLEDPETRRRLGKPEAGHITVSARHEGSRVIVEISDDGRGLDTARLRAKAAERGLATSVELDRMADAQAQKIIFQPGFSTAAKVTNVSGRGVGLDVVRSNIELIGGSVDVRSVKGEGTTFIIKIPLTLAIISALVVEAAGQRFAIPQLSVLEVVRVHAEGEPRIEIVNGAAMLRLRGALLPLLHLGSLLGLERGGAEAAGARALIAAVQVGVASFGLIIDRVCGNEEIVVKPLSSMLRDLELFCGNTILGDGSVIMILDPNGLAQRVAANGLEMAQAPRDAEEVDADGDDDAREALLLFRAGAPEPKAVPLAAVARLEDIDLSAAEIVDGCAMVHYRGGLMPLVCLEGVASSPESERPVLVFTDGQRLVGLVVDDVIDIVEDRLVIDAADGRPGLLGSAIIKGRATQIVDASHILGQAHGGTARLDAPAPHAVRGLGRALLVDDSDFFRDLLTPVVAAAGYEVTQAASAGEALRRLAADGPFDAVIADIDLPEHGAGALARVIGVGEPGAGPRLIGLVTRLSEGALDDSRRAGYHDLIGKFDREGLTMSLEAGAQGWAAAA